MSEWALLATRTGVGTNLILGFCYDDVKGSDTPPKIVREEGEGEGRLAATES
jgi:hypothetical protein